MQLRGLAAPTIVVASEGKPLDAAQVALEELRVIQPPVVNVCQILSANTGPEDWKRAVWQVLSTDQHHALLEAGLLPSFADEEVNLWWYLVAPIDELQGLAERVRDFLIQTPPASGVYLWLIGISAATDRNAAIEDLRRLEEILAPEAWREIEVLESDPRGTFVSRLRAEGRVFSEPEMERQLRVLMEILIAPRGQSAHLQWPKVSGGPEEHMGSEAPVACLGLSALRVPIAEMLRSIRGRLGSEIISTIRPKDRPVDRQAAEAKVSKAATLEMVDAPSVFSYLLQDLAVEVEASGGDFRVAIRPEYIQPPYRLLSAHPAPRWPELMEEFAAVLGEVKVTRWVRRISDRAKQWLDEWEKTVAKDLDNLLREPQAPVESVEALSEQLQERSDSIVGPRESGASWDDISQARDALEEALEAVPSFWALVSRYTFAALPLAYAFWYLAGRFSGTVKWALLAACALTPLTALALMIFKIAYHNQAVRRAVERCVETISSHYAARLKDKAAAEMARIQTHLRATAEQLKSMAEHLRSHLELAERQLTAMGADYDPPESLVEQWIVDREQLRAIYQDQCFDIDQLSKLALREGLLLGHGRSAPTAEDIAERALSVAERATEALQISPFVDLCDAKLLEDLGETCSDLFEKAVPAVGGGQHARDAVNLVIPQDFPDVDPQEMPFGSCFKYVTAAYLWALVRLRAAQPQPPAGSDGSREASEPGNG